MSFWKPLMLCAVGVLALGATQVSPSQVVVGIGVAPDCPYGYFDYEPYDCAPYGYYGPDWFAGGMWTIGMIRAMGIMGRCRIGETINLIISKGMRLATDMGMSVRRVIRRAVNMRCRASMGVGVGRRVVADRTVRLV
jgi:hypothetical protein